MKSLEYAPDKWLSFLRLEDGDLLHHCRMDVFKATGKGGQKKNKTSNAIRLTLDQLSVTESQSRSRSENIHKALKKMRLAIALDERREDTVAKNTCSKPHEIEPYLTDTEININPKNPVFPFFVGYLFDVFLLNKGAWHGMSTDTGFSTTQIRKFLEKNSDIKRKFSEIKASGYSIADPV